MMSEICCREVLRDFPERNVFDFSLRKVSRFTQAKVSYAGVAQLVERNLAKVEVASSNLVARSTAPTVGIDSKA